MAIVDALLPEFDHEVAVTRKLLERLADDRLDWKPHQKSWSMGGLATHIVNLPMWGQVMLDAAEFNIEPSAAPNDTLTSRAEILDAFDRHTAATRSSLAGKTDAEFVSSWTLKKDGYTIFTMPRVAVFRSMMMNHLIHHRGQLSIYLRLNDLPVPSIYGPSADESA